MNLALDNKWEIEMTNFCINNLNNVDSILLGRKTSEDFIPYWADVAQNSESKDIFHSKLGKPIHETPKFIFSNTLTESKWENATILNGDISKTIKSLKELQGKDILVYGGNSFATSLLQNELVDECCLLVNPAAIGNGRKEFNPIAHLNLPLTSCSPFDCSVVLLYYSR